MDVTLEKPFNGYRRCKADKILLNLSGKRTEKLMKKLIAVFGRMVQPFQVTSF